MMAGSTIASRFWIWLGKGPLESVGERNPHGPPEPHPGLYAGILHCRDHHYVSDNVSQQQHRTNTQGLGPAAALVLMRWAISLIDYCSSFSWCGPG